MKFITLFLISLSLSLCANFSVAQPADITFSSLAVPCNVDSAVVAVLGVGGAGDFELYSFSLVNGMGDDDNDSFILVDSLVILNNTLVCEPRSVRLRVKATPNPTGAVIEKTIEMRIRESSYEIQQLSLATPNSGVNEIAVVNKEIVWITTYDGEINRTINGGVTWTNVSIPDLVGQRLGTIWSTSPDSAWVTVAASTIQTGIYMTSDGGQHWARQSTAYNISDNVNHPFPDNIYFFNSKEGFVLGDFNNAVHNNFEMYTTKNGGATWTLVPSANIEKVSQVTFDWSLTTDKVFDTIGDTLFFISGQGRFYRSIDRGYHWSTPFGFPTSGGDVGFVEFTNSRKGILGFNNVIYKTTDGGNSWESVVPNAETAFVFTASLSGIDKILVAQRPLYPNPLQNNILTLTDDYGTTEVDARLDASFNNVLSVGTYGKNTFWVGQSSDQIIKYSELQSVIEMKEGDEPKLNEESLVFSSTGIGKDQIKQLKITNTGNANLVISDIQLTGDYALESPIPSSIVPENSVTLSVKFAPTNLGSRVGILTVLSNGDVPIFRINLVGKGEVEPEVYNVVTANQNGKHDFLNIKNITFFPKNKMTIFDRWGNKVFEKDGYDNAQVVFTGISDDNKQLPDGTYFYVLDKKNGDKPMNGFIYLRR